MKNKNPWIFLAFYICFCVLTISILNTLTFESYKAFYMTLLEFLALIFGVLMLVLFEIIPFYKKEVIEKHIGTPNGEADLENEAWYRIACIFKEENLVVLDNIPRENECLKIFVINISQFDKTIPLTQGRMVVCLKSSKDIRFV